MLFHFDAPESFKQAAPFFVVVCLFASSQTVPEQTPVAFPVPGHTPGAGYQVPGRRAPRRGYLTVSHKLPCAVGVGVNVQLGDKAAGFIVCMWHVRNGRKIPNGPGTGCSTPVTSRINLPSVG